MDGPSFIDHLMLRKFFGGDSSAELILLIRPKEKKGKGKYKTLHGETHDPHGLLSLEIRTPSSFDVCIFIWKEKKKKNLLLPLISLFPLNKNRMRNHVST